MLVRWPLKLNEDDTLLYLTNIAIEDPVVGNSRCFGGEYVNYKGLKNEVRERRSAEYKDLPPVNCGDDDNTECAQFRCEIDKLERGTIIKFKFMARLWESTLYNKGNVNVTSYVEIESVKQQDMVFGPEGKSAMKSQFYPSSATRRNYLWIIIGSIIAGIFLLILLIIILWKCGFFKRKAPPPVMAEKVEEEG